MLRFSERASVLLLVQMKLPLCSASIILLKAPQHIIRKHYHTCTYVFHSVWRKVNIDRKVIDNDGWLGGRPQEADKSSFRTLNHIWKPELPSAFPALNSGRRLERLSNLISTKIEISTGLGPCILVRGYTYVWICVLYACTVLCIYNSNPCRFGVRIVLL